MDTLGFLHFKARIRDRYLFEIAKECLVIAHAGLRRRARLDMLGTKNDAHAAVTNLVEQPVWSCAGWTRSHP